MLKNKTIIVVGSCESLLWEITNALTANEATVFICDQEHSTIRDTHSILKHPEAPVLPRTILCPGENAIGITEVVSRIGSLTDRLDGLIFLPPRISDCSFSTLYDATLEDAFNASVRFPILFSQEIVRHLMKQEGPKSIIFTVNSAALDASDHAIYAGISGGALIGAARSLALELGADGIRVNCVCPGQARDQITEEEAAYVALIADIPRPAEPGEIAGPYLYLMSDYSTHVSGQVIRVDGGIR